eukprot:3951599-Amphidinium_carterae.1
MVPKVLTDEWKSVVGEQIITQVELYPVILVRWVMKLELAGRRLIWCIDNEPARFTLIKGSSPSRVSRRLAEVFYKVEATAPSYPWFARVPSFSNPADKPSRGCLLYTSPSPRDRG